jgi:TM2 domain-containing membrane protein YozV
MKPAKNPGVAAVLSFFFTGLGQIYNGQIGKGIAFIAVGVVNLLLTLVIIGFITAPIFWIFNIYDAYKGAEKFNAQAA